MTAKKLGLSSQLFSVVGVIPAPLLALVRKYLKFLNSISLYFLSYAQSYYLTPLSLLPKNLRLNPPKSIQLTQTPKT